MTKEAIFNTYSYEVDNWNHALDIDGARKAMDAYLSAFGEWADEQSELDTELWHEALHKKRPVKFLAEQFILHHKESLCKPYK